MSDPRLAVIGCPYDDNSSFMKGAAEAPPAIRAALFTQASSLWSEDGVDLGAGALITNAGDMPPCPAEAVNDRIETGIAKLLNGGYRPLVLGGDHSITYPIVKAVSQKHAGLTVVQFDAHPDLYDEFQGNRYSHACPFARIMEMGTVKRLVQVGIRTITGHHREQIKRFAIDAIEMRDWHDSLPALDSPVYISFDIDALDPAFAPGVVHREPGGLSVRQAIAAIQSLAVSVAGADIVEFNPRMDLSRVTAAICAKLLKEIAAKMLAG